MRSAIQWGLDLTSHPIWDGNVDALENTESHPLVQYYEHNVTPAMEGFLDWLPVVRVEEKDGVIRCSGFSAPSLVTDIVKLYGTSRITNNIFITLDRRSFTCYSFFAIEVMYILNSLIETPRKNTSNTTLNSIMSAMMEESWIGQAMQSEPLAYDISRPEKLLLNPNNGEPFSFLPNQKGFIEDYAVRTPKTDISGNILHSPPGTGKTMTGYAFHLAFNCDVTIYVVPLPTLKNVWEKELMLGWRKTPDYWTSSDNKPITGRESIVLCHYESLERVLREANRFKGKKVCLWLDESHNFVESVSQRTERFVQLAHATDAFSVIWASGTPLKAMGKETIPILRTVDRKRFTPMVEAAYKKVYGMSMSHALTILNHRLKHITFKVEKRDIVNNEMEEIVLPVNIPVDKPYRLDVVKTEMAEYVNSQFQYYERVTNDTLDRWRIFMSKIGKRISSAIMPAFENYQRNCDYLRKYFNPRDPEMMEILKQRKRFEVEYIYSLLDNPERAEFKKLASIYTVVILVVRGEALGRILTRRRIECFTEIARHAEYTKFIDSAASNTIIFTNYIESAKVLYERFKTAGYETFIAIGETSNDLKDNLDKLRNRRGAVIIATYKSLGVGVPVTMCNVMIFNDLPFRDYMLNQAKSRIDRIGAKHALLFVTAKLYTGEHPNLAGRTQDILDWSAGMVDAMLNLPTTDVDYDSLVA